MKWSDISETSHVSSKIIACALVRAIPPVLADILFIKFIRAATQQSDTHHFTVKIILNQFSVYFAHFHNFGTFIYSEKKRNHYQIEIRALKKKKMLSKRGLKRPSSPLPPSTPPVTRRQAKAKAKAQPPISE